jgi:MurNAc alpha-1-phosphate uridylyltransferase
MKAMILAAGRGERMRPLTDTTPKPLLKVAGQCLIEYHIKALVKAGVTQLLINHSWLGEQIELALGDGSQYGAEIQYSPEATALETAGGIINALSFLNEEPFIVANGDIFTDYPFENLLKLKMTKLAHLVLVDNPQHHPQGDFYYQNNTVLNPGNTVLNQNNTVLNPNNKVSKPSDDISQRRYTYSGIALYDPEFFHGLAAGKQALGPLLRAAMDNYQVSGEYYHGFWLDIGTPERLYELEKELS